MAEEGFLEDLMTLPDLNSALVSPDGKWAAWTWFKTGPAADVFVVNTDLTGEPAALTNTLDNTYLVSWTPDSRAVLVMQDHDGDERFKLYRVYLDQPGQMELLTEPAPNYFLRGGQLHPSGQWLFYGANQHPDTGLEIENTLIYRLDLASGEKKVLAKPLKPGSSGPKLNTQGTYILYNRKDLDSSGLQTWLVDVEGKEDREILNFGPKSKVFASWFPDGERMLVLAENEYYRRLGVWHLGSESLIWLVDDPARNLEEAFVPHGSNLAVVVEIKQARAVASLLNTSTGEEMCLETPSGNLIPLAPYTSEDGTKTEWIGRYYSSNQPGDLVRFSLKDVQTNAFKSMTGVWNRTVLRPTDLKEALNFNWKSVDGLEIQGWLYKPDLPAKGTIIFVHGGPTAHSEDRLNTQIQYLVNQGFNVLAPNYRGSTGFSLAFQESIKQEGWGGLEQDDIKAGIEALLDAGIATAGKVGITGTSYGGYSSWCALTRWPLDIVAASAPICGMTDLVIDYETTRPDLRPYSESMLGGRPDQVPQKYFARSPINFIGNIKGKLLIIQGQQDPNVTPENVKVVSNALEQKGIKFDLLIFEDEGHGISKPKNQKILYNRLVDFFSGAFN